MEFLQGGSVVDKPRVCTCGGTGDLSKLCIVCLDLEHQRLTRQCKQVFQWLHYRVLDDIYKNKTQQ